MKTIVYLYASQPIALDQNKISTLHRSGEYRVHLVYWDRLDFSLRIPFTTALPDSQVHRLPTRFQTLPWLGQALVRIRVLFWFLWIIARLRPAVIHACSFDCYIAARLALWILPGCRMVVDLQDTPDWMWNPKNFIWQRWIWARAGLVFVTSPLFDSHFLKRFGLLHPRARVTFIPNSPASHQLQRCDRPRLDSQGLVLGYIGGFRGWETFHTLTLAAGRLWEKGLEFKLFFAGVGFWQQQVEHLSRENSQVNYWGPFVYDRDIQRVYDEIDLVFACYDPCPDKMIHLACRFAEAVVSGKPVIVGENTFMADLVREYDIGCAVPPNNPAALAEAIGQCYAQPARYQRMCDNTQGLRQSFFYDAYEETLLREYRNLLMGEQPGKILVSS